MSELMKAHGLLVTLLLCSGLLTAQPHADEDASALEARYKTCAKHYIPAEKCTLEIYQQLKAKANAPLDPIAAAALKAVKEYQTRLKNPDSMQVRTAYVTAKALFASRSPLKSVQAAWASRVSCTSRQTGRAQRG